MGKKKKEKTSKLKIKTFEDLHKLRCEIEAAMPPSPFPEMLYIDDVGNVVGQGDLYLTPMEAYRVAKWLDSFYDGDIKD